MMKDRDNIGLNWELLPTRQQQNVVFKKWYKLHKHNSARWITDAIKELIYTHYGSLGYYGYHKFKKKNKS